jgi:DNA-binding NarL/FixJ family response regulator
MRAVAELRDPSAIAIALIAGLIAVAIAVPWPIALAAALAVLCVRILAGLAFPRAALRPSIPGDGAGGPGGALSPRELTIAEHVYEGLTNRQIADRLVIAERTVDNHVQHILTKLDFHSRSQIARWWAERTMSTRK